MKSRLFKTTLITIFLFISLFLLLFASPTQASRIETLKDLKNFNDFDLGPTLFYIDANSGDSFDRTLQLTNRSGKLGNYAVEVENFQGSKDNPSQTIVLLGKKDSPYGARDWTTLELDRFSLQHAERIFFNVNIKVPANVSPGDYYAAVLVRAVPEDQNQATNAPTVKITSRVGSLFVLRIAGDVVESGQLDSFSTGKKFYSSPPVDFRVIFKNTGTVLLQPAGQITIKNIFGRTVDTIEIQPFRTLRDSIRLEKVSWEKKYLCGYYTADLKLNRGYGNIIDEKSISFWILPWKFILLALFTLTLIIAIIIFLRRNVSISFRAKKKR